VEKCSKANLENQILLSLSQKDFLEKLILELTIFVFSFQKSDLVQTISDKKEIGGMSLSILIKK